MNTGIHGLLVVVYLGASSLAAGADTGGANTGTTAVDRVIVETDDVLEACGVAFTHVHADDPNLDGALVTFSGQVALEPDGQGSLKGSLELRASGPDEKAWPLANVVTSSYGEPVMQDNTVQVCDDDAEAICHATADGYTLSNAVVDNALGINYTPAGDATEETFYLNLWQPDGAAETMEFVTACIERLFEVSASQAGY